MSMDNYNNSLYRKTLARETQVSSNLPVEAYLEEVEVEVPQGGTTIIYTASYHWSTPNWKKYNVKRMVDADQINNRVDKLKSKVEQFKNSNRSLDEVTNLLDYLDCYCNGGDL